MRTRLICVWPLKMYIMRAEISEHAYRSVMFQDPKFWVSMPATCDVVAETLTRRQKVNIWWFVTIRREAATPDVEEKEKKMHRKTRVELCTGKIMRE